jgi:ABC-2 type transport system ATP-binding protein
MEIKFEAVTKTFGKKVAVNDLSFQLGPGEIIGFVGPNGAGKTTTMRLMLGLTFPEKGEIYYNGVTQEQAMPQIRGFFGYLPENNPLPEEMLVADYLEFFARVRGVRDEAKKIRKVAEELGFTEYLLQPLANLSKGYRQRVGIAAALLADPEVLVLDEPQEGLDPAQRLEIRRLIKELGRERTIILSTHILNEVVETCKRVILINNGKIVLDDSIERALKQISSRSYRLTIKGSAALEKIKSRFGKEAVEEIKREENVMSLRVFSDKDIREEIFRFCVEENLILLELVEESASLEDIFLKLTGKEDA